MTLGQVLDSLLGHGQPLCEILSRFNLAVRSYRLGMDLGYVCTVTLALEINYTWFMDNNWVKYYPESTCYDKAGNVPH